MGANLRRFNASQYKKIAHVVMGEPGEDYKKAQQEMVLTEKQANLDATWKAKKIDFERRKQIREARKKADEARAQKVAEAKAKAEEIKRKVQEEKEKKAKAEAEKKAEESKDEKKE